jgi:hypothetical protein
LVVDPVNGIDGEVLESWPKPWLLRSVTYSRPCREELMANTWTPWLMEFWDLAAWVLCHVSSMESASFAEWMTSAFSRTESVDS